MYGVCNCVFGRVPSLPAWMDGWIVHSHMQLTKIVFLFMFMLVFELCMHVSVSVSEYVYGNVSALSSGFCWLLSLFHFSVIILSKCLLVGSGE